MGSNSASDGIAVSEPAKPPLIPFALCVGVTGHRQEALPPECLQRLPGQIRDALALLTRSATTVHASAADCFAPGRPLLQFVSPLAEGADQVAAEVALELGYSLHAVLRSQRRIPPDFSSERVGSQVRRVIEKVKA